jgi:nucleoside-diphosphate-sugar epimerase
MFDIDIQSLESTFNNGIHIDAIIHLATCYGRNGENEIDIFSSNTLFPLELLRLSTSYKSTTFINIDTILCEYLNAYALSKYQFVQWGKLFAQTKRVQFLNIRLEQVYGPNDDLSKFTSLLIQSCVEGELSIPMTKGEQMRDFIFIYDVVAALMLILEKVIGKGVCWQELGLGSGSPVSIKHFAKTVKKLSNSNTKLDFGALDYRNNEVMTSSADISKLNECGWTRKWSLEEGILNSIEDCRRRL